VTASLGLSQLAAVLYYAAGVTRKKTYPGGGEVLFRAAASTGALYRDRGVRRGRRGRRARARPLSLLSWRLHLAACATGTFARALSASAADDSIARRSATILLTAIYWRNAWKYQARAYRHLFWDSGTMLANVLAVGGALGLAPRVLTGFVDVEVDRLLGLDTTREVALELIVLGPEAAAAPAGGALDSIDHATLPLSSSEVDYPLIREMHAASGLGTASAVSTWRGREWSHTGPMRPVGAKLVQLPPPPSARAGRGLGETIRRAARPVSSAHASSPRRSLTAL
jgi:hypothetical protein